jgi:predicted PurR-regulated permease PerM
MLAMAIDQAGAADPYPWWWIILGPTIVYFAFQTLDDYVLTPAIQGKNVGLSTPVILFAVLGAGALAGVYGILIAIPIAACIKIIVTDVVLPRYRAWVEGKADDPLPIGGRDEGTEGTP